MMATKDLLLEKQSSVTKVARDGMMISTKTYDGETLQIKTNSLEKIIDVKRKISKETNFTVKELTLTFQSFILDDEKFVGEYEISDGSVINIYVTQRDCLVITAKMYDKFETEVKIERNEKVINVKRKIRKQMRLVDEKPTLTLGNLVLEDEKVVGEYEIPDGSVISVYMKLNLLDMTVHVRTFDNRTFSIKTNKFQKVMVLKMQIQDEIGMKPIISKILFEEQILDDDKTVEEARITDQCELFVAG